MRPIVAVALGLLVIPNPAFSAVHVMEPIEVETPKVFITAGKCNKCSIAEADKLRLGVAKVNDTVKTQCFRDAMRSRALIQTNGKTADQVVDSLTGVKVDLEMYYTWKRVLGYTLPTVNKIWINEKYLRGWSVCDVGSLLAHEASHKVGYDHDKYSNKQRPFSVPYSVNFAFDKCCIK